MNTIDTQQHGLWIACLVAFLALAVSLPGLSYAEEKAQPQDTEKSTITVYKTPTCGCCKKWVTHLEQNGFKVTANDMTRLDHIKTQAGIQPGLASCHTAVVEGYTIEGHVPASDIRRLLEEKPDVIGLTVPGMPMGSPGMEGPRQDAYQVLTFDKEGNTTVFTQY